MNSADKALAVMRRQVRAADEITLINKRAYNIFRSMRERAKEIGHESEIDFDVEWLRGMSRTQVGLPCQWCKRTLTAKNFSWDHPKPIIRGGSFCRMNLLCICSVCNGQKGQLHSDEFAQLRNLLEGFAQQAKADVLRRLGLGARWRS